MSFLRALFGPSKEEVWTELCRQIGAEFVDGGWWGVDKVQAHVKDWTITLDTYTVSTGKSSTTYTRMRAPYVNKDGLRFTVYRKGLFTELGKLLRLVQDIEVGHLEFDRDFVIQGNDAAKVRALFANPRIRELLQTQPSIYFHVADDEGWFGAKFPGGVDELRFQVHGVIKDVPRLRNLFDLFAETLNQLCHLDSAYEDDVSLHIEALRAPGGQIKDGRVLLWEGDTSRQRAAEGLGRLKDPKAVEPLMQVLSDSDNILRVKAIWALGEIGDARAVPALIPLLGDAAQAVGGSFSAHSVAADALRKLGEGELVEAFSQTLSGDKTALPNLKGKYRSETVQGFIKALNSPDVSTIVNAAWALSELGALESLPHLRSKVGFFSFPSADLKAACVEALNKLETLAALPRPAEAAATDMETLPRPAGEPEPSKETLPRPSDVNGLVNGFR